MFRIPGAWEEGSKILGKYGIEFKDRSVSMWEAAALRHVFVTAREGEKVSIPAAVRDGLSAYAVPVG